MHKGEHFDIFPALLASSCIPQHRDARTPLLESTLHFFCGRPACSTLPHTCSAPATVPVTTHTVFRIQ